MKKTLVHMLEDSPICVDFLNFYRGAIGENIVEKFWVAGDLSKGKGRFLTQDVLSELQLVETKELSSVDLVVVHFLGEEKIPIVTGLRSNVIVLWMMWGADYIRFLPDDVVYGEKTSDFLRGREQNLRGRLARIKRKVLALMVRKKWISAVNRVNYYGVSFSGELEKLSSCLGLSKQFRQFDFFYYPAVVEGANLEGGSRIMVGHSASPSLNHAEIFLWLSKTTKNSCIYSMLSYGDPCYSRFVTEIGRNLFGRRFLCEHEFLSREAYHEKLGSVGIALFGNTRQQGFGNIVEMLGLGIAVYLSDRNTILTFLRKSGFIVFSIDELMAGQLPPRCLSAEEKENNNKLISGLFSPERLLGMYRNELERVLFN